MICEKTVRKICKDFTKIENYEKAMADTTQTWICHHRLETHNSDGERRLADLRMEELKALGMYFDRPPEELIFMTHSYHSILHNKGKPKSEEMRRKLSEVNRGKKYGPHSEETKRKISEANKGKGHSEEWAKKVAEANRGKKRSEESRRRMAESHKGQHKGMHWKLVDGKRVWY